MGLTVRFLAFFSLVMSALSSSVFAEGWAVPEGPLRVRNTSPAVQLYGLPLMTGARIIDRDWELSFNTEIGNNFQSDSVDGTLGFFDGETYVNSYRVGKGIGGNWEWGWGQ